MVSSFEAQAAHLFLLAPNGHPPNMIEKLLSGMLANGNNQSSCDLGVRPGKLCLGPALFNLKTNEPPHGKTNNLPRRKQRHRSASR